MAITVVSQGRACRLIFSGDLTYEFAREIEDGILDSLRRYTRFEVDLSAVRAVDLCGIHLLGLLHNLACNAVEIVADSATVEEARKNLLSAPRNYWLRGGGCGREARA